MEYYIEQVDGYEIGNFINCTPTIKTLYEYYREKVPVKFNSNIVRDMFLEWECISAINETKDKALLFDSSLRNQVFPDYQFIHEKVTAVLGIYVDRTPHTYVDHHNLGDEYKGSDYIVIIRGGRKNGYWEEKKEVGDDIYQYIIERIPHRIIYIGTDHDYQRSIERMEKWRDCEVVLNDIRKSLALINQAKYIISNDTGMYHAAGALNKDIFVVWKDTPFIKNKSPGKNCFYSMKGNWHVDFNHWYPGR